MIRPELAVSIYYLKCLHSCRTLTCTELSHLQTDQYYKDVLAGKPPLDPSTRKKPSTAFGSDSVDIWGFDKIPLRPGPRGPQEEVPDPSKRSKRKKVDRDLSHLENNFTWGIAAFGCKPPQQKTKN